MMRNTCALQVSLDTGRGATRQERWVVANLISPILTAMFASSPGFGVRSHRARTWQRLDPTRTGFPQWEGVDDVDPMRDLVERALKADVIYVNRNGVTTRGRKGWTFGDWVEGGHPTVGSPTPADLDVHLTTLFAEVRPRNGTLEFRGIDGMPQRWWHVPLVIVGALLYDPSARQEAMDVLGPIAPRLNETWATAAREGLDDPELGLMARAVAELGLTAARRDPDRFDVQLTDSTEAFLDVFTFRGRSPADDLFPLLEDSRTALAWTDPDHAMKGTA
jgi:glutamate--cysteine ligase